MESYNKFETNTIKIKNYGGRGKLSDVTCSVCSYQWRLMAKRIRCTHCPKCHAMEKMASLEKDEFITFDKGEDVKYNRDIFSYKCNVCDKKFAKSFYEISLNGPCIPSCEGELERAKVLAKKGGCECLGYSEVKLYHFESDKEKNPDSYPSYTADEILAIVRKADNEKKSVQ